ncbi:MAG: deoxyribose-phosphate aldolase [Devosia nanyangense]|uniref:Deoxyribose-phosphate aldolase n=1 Tax=Devosia nanyangense TaxID=1228055 RepID=A0A933L2W6_9HYPH|nr:deoxyribose-phosphate aldolase [Devosia nanyangense]
MTLPLRGDELARHIDVSCVQAFHSAADIAELARIANAHGFVAAHVLPHFVPRLQANLGAGAKTLVGAPVGFPSGGATTATKLAEARELVTMGAQELDLMINVGRLISGDTAYVDAEIKAVIDAVAPLPVKVLLEVHYLSDDQIRIGCELAIKRKAAFVKTSTGWSPGGATIDKVRVIREATRGAIGIKASGGIRDFATIDALSELGVTRFGINSRVAVELVTHQVGAGNGR